MAGRVDRFLFDRFDVHAPSEEAFRAGELTMLERNRPASDATKFYDPAVLLAGAHRTLFRPGELAFANGAANAAAVPSGVLRGEVNLALPRRAPGAAAPFRAGHRWRPRRRRAGGSGH